MDDTLDEPLCVEKVLQERGSVCSREAWRARGYFVLHTLIDVVCFCGFIYFLLFLAMPTWARWTTLGVLLALLCLWRALLWRWRCSSDVPDWLPYTVHKLEVGDKELWLVGTLHISPKSPEDVKKVIETTRPDLVMIELDEERLNRMRRNDLEAAQPPAQTLLQPVIIDEQGGKMTLFAQRATWNGEKAGQTIAGDLVYNKSDPHGLAPSRGLNGNILVAQRGPSLSTPAEQARVSFKVKAHLAARAGAGALLVVDSFPNLPHTRVGSGSLKHELRVFIETRSCSFPPIPVLMLCQTDGNALCERLDLETVHAKFTIEPDKYPRRTLRRQICESFALLFSGIGILYGIIGCFKVDVGDEFMIAEKQAHAEGVPCACIDVNTNKLWSRIGWSLLPTPTNVLDAVLSWLAFPRVLFRALFPGPSRMDVLGGMVLHTRAFSCRIWIAFGLAGVVSSFVLSHMLLLLTATTERGMEAAHIVNKSERGTTKTWIMLLVEVYLMARVYASIVASRDLTMYQMIVNRAREYSARRLVAVVGAGHANGILKHARSGGL